VGWIDVENPSVLQAELAGILAGRRLGRPVLVHGTLDSTQDEARRLVALGATEGTLVLALEQTAGRGRLQRAWVSARGAGIWFSLVLRPGIQVEAAGFLSIVAGVGAAEGLRAATGADVRLKWPNDLMARDRKLGGILAEAQAAGQELRFVILGIGINLEAPQGELATPAIGLAELADHAQPAGVLAAVLERIEHRYYEYLDIGAEPARRAWLDLSMSLGRTFEAGVDGTRVRGRAVDLDPGGGLVLEAGGVRVVVRSGEAVLIP
jgi:BirA family biotin operon repressor/biotin-[acetyl-CoA-carboxylase] ligase